VQKRPTVAVSVYDAQDRLVLADDAARPMAFDPANAAVEASKQRPAGERYYGFGSFNDLLEEARARGYVELERDAKSGGYIVRPVGTA